MSHVRITACGARVSFYLALWRRYIPGALHSLQSPPPPPPPAIQTNARARTHDCAQTHSAHRAQ